MVDTELDVVFLDKDASAVSVDKAEESPVRAIPCVPKTYKTGPPVPGLVDLGACKLDPLFVHFCEIRACFDVSVRPVNNRSNISIGRDHVIVGNGYSACKVDHFAVDIGNRGINIKKPAVNLCNLMVDHGHIAEHITNAVVEGTAVSAASSGRTAASSG